jgi:hypothetical protein
LRFTGRVDIQARRRRLGTAFAVREPASAPYSKIIPLRRSFR